VCWCVLMRCIDVCSCVLMLGNVCECECVVMCVGLCVGVC
jgi:hypothetical protein